MSDSAPKNGADKKIKDKNGERAYDYVDQIYPRLNVTEETKKKKPGPKPKPKPTTEDVVKLTAPLTKKAKALAGEAFDKKKLMDYLNSLGKEGYEAKTFDEHIKVFYEKKEEEPKVPETQTEEVDMEEREFEGKTYLVDPNTKRVYEEREDGLPIAIGYAGMRKFEGLKVV